MNKQTNTALKMAIEALENSLVYCENLHHAKKDQHKYSDPCPVEQRWDATIQACKKALEQPAHLTVPQQIEKSWDDAVGVVMPNGKVHLLKELVVGDLLFKR